jgi:amino acid adenylation domain-containing protein
LSTPRDLEGSIAIVGMAGRFPGARNLEQLWRNLREGVDSVRSLSDEELAAMGVPAAQIADPNYVKVAAQPDGVDRFDAGFFGINPREAEILDPQQRVLLEVAWETLEDAGYDPAGLGEAGTMVGVFAGSTLSTYLLFNLMPQTALLEAMDPLQLLVGNTGDSLATRISYKLNLRGPSYTIQSACSTSLVAVHNACQSLVNGECDMALAGGVSLNMSLLAGYRRKDGSVFSPDGRCRAFDARAQGILFGGGAGLVALKRLEDALADGDAVRAVIRGSAVNNDGAFKVGYTAPSIDGQAEVITEALAAAGVEPESISYIEAHGTGTRLGDPIEVKALTRAFGAETGRRQLIPMGSIKTNFGHLDVAAGIAGLIKTVLSLQHRQIPPTLHFTEPNPEIDFAASPVRVNTELADWPANGAPRRAGVSSFGFGGTNAHVVLEEAPELPARHPIDRDAAGEWRLLPLSARSEKALAAVAADLAAHLEAHPELDLAAVAHTLQVGRRDFEHRRVVLCRSLEEAVSALRSLDPQTPPDDGLADIGRRWLAGEAVDWPEVPGGSRRVPLPTYPFERESFWIAAPGIPRPGAPLTVEAAGMATPEQAMEANPLLAMAAPLTQTFHARPNLFNPYEPPRGETETKVVTLWQEVLGVEPVGIHDNFFQLGGHSLLATQILSRVREMFGIDFPLQQLFAFPTAAELAEAIAFLVSEKQAESGGAVSAAQPEAIGISPRRATGGPYPLSFAQERLWFLDQFEPGTPAFNIPAATRLRGTLDQGALEESLNRIVQRHETLRTRFFSEEGKAWQEVLPELRLTVELEDLSNLPEEERRAAERRIVMEHSARSFDLSRGPLLSTLLLRLAADDHLLVFSIHHTVADGWSLGVLQSELARHYRAALRGEPTGLPPLPLQYADFADWQRRRFQGETLERELAFWRPQLAGVPFLELRGDRPRPPVQTFRGGYEDFAVPAPLARAAEALAQQEGISLFMVLLAGFKLLLQRYAQQDDFAVGALIANRNRAELEGMIGSFVNNLALRTDLTGDGERPEGPDGRELLRRVRETTLAAYAHQDIPFEKLIEELHPERDMSRGALIQVMFNLLNFPTVHEELPGLTLSSSGVRGERANFDLTLWMTEGREGLVGWMEYNADIFDRSTVRQMVGHLLRLLEGLTSDPGRPAGDLPLLAAAERAQVLVEWNRTGRERAWETGFLGLFGEQVERAPEAVAASCAGKSLTYAELSRRSARLARWLAGRGIGPDSVVPILSERGLDFLTAVVGVLRSGAAYLPLDPKQPPPRAARVVRQSGATLVLAGTGHADRLQPAWEWGSCPEVVPYKGLLDGPANEEVASPARRELPDNLAYVMFTSGSTGVPKGAMLTHRGLFNHLLMMVEDLELTAADTVAQNTVQSFDISVWQLLTPLMIGGRVAVVLDEVAHDPLRLLVETERERITILEVVPSLLGAMLDGLGSGGEGAARPDLSALRWMVPTGEAVPPDLCRRWLETYPEVPLINAYGPTECSDDVSFYVMRTPPPEGVQIPIGKPTANIRLYVLDRGLRPLPAGVGGELCIGGSGLGRGYLYEPERTAEAFIPDPFAGLAGEEPGGRLYRTGDLARLRADGNLEFLGRIDHQVKLRGFRIELGEIEAALGAFPGVRQAVVNIVEGGPGGRRLVGYVTALREEGGLEAALDPAELKRFVAERLPEYMVPSAFVVLSDLPLTPHGKVDRRALPAPELRAESDELVAPRTEVEELMADIWKQVLGIDRVGAFDSFFALGGHSLVAAQVAAKIRQTFDVELPLRTVFEAPTLGELALAVEELMIAKLDSLDEEDLEELS